MAEFPSGTVTFLFTDLEGSTRLWQLHPEAMKTALARHDEVLREAIEGHAGEVVKTTGDGFHAAFSAAHDALHAAVAGQLALAAERWEATGPLPVRMGIHTGPAELRDGDYYGTAVNRAARLMSAGHGGQIVVSLATEELVQESGVELLDLGEHVLRDLARPERVFQVVHPGLRSEFPRLSSLDAFPGNLPAQVTSFVGRDDDLAILARLLDAERLVTVTGVGGVGKTRLAIQVAALVLPAFPDGTWLCELAAANDGDSMDQLVAATFGVQSREGMSIGGAVREYLRTKTLLVVFDNCEHLLEPAGRLAHAVLRACPHVRILATSRERLGVDGEHVQVLRALDLPEVSADASSVARADAARLFIDRARAVNPSLVLDTSTVAAIGELCRHLDGVPLAIELAAARVGAMSPAEIVAHLDERFRLLSGGRRSAIDRHQTLRATVDWSYSLLTGAEQLVFTRLGTFPGTFESAAAEAVATGDGIEGWDVLDALTSLVDKSMLVADAAPDASTRYSMLETLRSYARERLDETGDADARRRRHAQHYATFAEELGPRLHSVDELAWRARLRAELDNLRAAVNWALDSPSAGDADLALRIIAALAYELPMDAATHVGVWATRAIPRGDETTGGRRTAVLGAAAVHAMFLGDLEAATTLARDAVRDGMPSDCPAPMTVPTARAMVHAYRGQFADALRVLREPIPDLEAAGDLFGLASMYSTVSTVAHFAGDSDAARTAAEEAVRLARQIRSPHAVALALFSLGNALASSDPGRALASFEECIALVEAGAGGRIVYGGALDGVGQLRASAGDPIGALQALRAAVAYARDSGNFTSFAGSLDGALPVLVQLDYPESVAVLAGITTRGAFAALGLVSDDEQHDRNQAMEAAQARLGREVYEHAVALGAAMTDDEALTYTLSELDRVLTETLPR